MEIGSHIKRVRENKELSASELARRAKISQPYLSQLESGRNKNPTLEIVRKISKELNISFLELMIMSGYVKEEDIRQYLKEVNK